MAESRTFPYTACMLLPNYEPTMVMVTHYADPGSEDGDGVVNDELAQRVVTALATAPAPVRAGGDALNDIPVRDMGGITWRGMHCAGWVWTVKLPEEIGGCEENRYACHWSTGPADAERLYRESDIRALIAALAAAPQEAPTDFPPRILALLRDVSDRKGTGTAGPWEDAHGEPLQDDADAALRWIASRAAAPQPAAAEHVVDANKMARPDHLVDLNKMFPPDFNALIGWLADEAHAAIRAAYPAVRTESLDRAVQSYFEAMQPAASTVPATNVHEAIPGPDANRIAILLDTVIRRGAAKLPGDVRDALHLARRIAGRYTVEGDPPLAAPAAVEREAPDCGTCNDTRQVGEGGAPCPECTVSCAPSICAPWESEPFVITEEWLHANRTQKGGYLAAQMKAIGTGWPPTQGWLKAAVGRKISQAAKAAFEAGAVSRAEARRANRAIARDESAVAHEGAPFGIIDPDYARIFTKARILAWSYGYACVAHGSFTRDLDLLLVPWTEQATADSAERIIRMIVNQCDLKEDKTPANKPHGRRNYSLHLKGFGEPRWVDVSVIPIVGIGSSSTGGGDE